MNDPSFSNKVVIVTGASSGLGCELALALAQKGARLALAARSTTALEGLAQKIRSTGAQALAVPTDMTNREQVDHMVSETVQHYVRVDVLISNAGQYIRSPIAQVTPDLLARSMAVNFYGAVYAVLGVMPVMQKQASGHIALVLTMDVKTPMVQDAPYVAAKSALSGFGEVLRQELKGSGIHVTEIYPGRIDTPMISHLRFSWVSPKMDPSYVAGAILSGIARRKQRIILPSQANLLNLINFLSPSLADRLAREFHLQGWSMEEPDRQ